MSKRFEILINGETICVAGLECFGVLSAIIDWVHRDPSAFTKSQKRRLSEGFFAERVNIQVGGRDYNRDFPSGEGFVWLNQELKEGDEICIRVLPPGPSDEPTDKGG